MMTTTMKVIKRYSLRSDNEFGEPEWHELTDHGYIECERETSDHWVPAEVAQALYDVVQRCKAMGMLTIGYDSGCDHKRLCSDAEDAIALADGDNT